VKASIFTPTHRPQYLHEAYASLRRQTVSDFEWVLVPNGPDLLVPEDIRKDPRVKVHAAPPEMAGNIGALKRFACSACSGDVFVELDHDDLLVPTALERILDAARSGAGFVYSDFANFYPNGAGQTYSEAMGWTFAVELIDGKLYQVMHAFECDARSLCEIFFAPNHVRAWTRSAYELAGGHDATLEVCDDHDLLCRTYLAGVEMRRIPECLYLYRLQEDNKNSFLERNDLIQKMQQQVSNKYFYRLVDEWAERQALPKVDLGGVEATPEGYQRVGLHEALERLPFADSSVSVVRAYDFFARVPPARVVPLMNELHRVLVPGGWLLSRTPSTDGRGAFQDPTHVSFWNENSFWYYTKRDFAQHVPLVQCRFQGTRVWNEFASEWHRTHDVLHVYADLMALKGQRHAGLREI